MKYISIVLTFTTLTLSGCSAKTGNSFLEETSQKDLSKDLVIGQTTKSQIKAKFGDPLQVDFDANGQEKWFYAFKRSDAKGINYVPIVGLFCGGTDDILKNLTLIFDVQGKLFKSAFSDNQHETVRGIFQ